MKEHDIVSDADLDTAYASANFGMEKREVIRLAVLKCASGSVQGHTSRVICEELGLIDEDYKITCKGQAYLWAAFSNGSNF